MKMLNTEEYKLLIESYLKGDLSTEQAAQFEKEASENPRLQNELALQKAIISSIQANRRAELKARLNKIDVKAGFHWQIGQYAAFLLGALSLLGLGTYYYLSTSAKQEPVFVTNLTEKEKTPSFDQKSEASKVSSSLETLVSSNAPQASTAPAPNLTKSSAMDEPENKGKETVPSLPELNAPEAPTHEALNKEMENPQHGLGKAASHLNASLTGVEVVKSKKHPFHYRYFDNKLFLYGDFEAKTYEILELNISKDQKLYLKFDSKYYALEPNKTEISKLEQVKDAETLTQLEEIQKK